MREVRHNGRIALFTCLVVIIGGTPGHAHIPNVAYTSARLTDWPSRDPIGERGGLNLYGFVGNNPIYKYDIYGMIYNDYISWKYEIMYDRARPTGFLDFFSSLSIKGGAKFIEISLPGTAPKRRRPCWTAIALIAHAEPTHNKSFSYQEDPNNPARLWSYDNDYHTYSLRYQPYVIFKYPDHEVHELLWEPNQIVVGYGKSDQSGWLYVTWTREGSLIAYKSVVLTLEREIQVRVPKHDNEQLSSLKFELLDKTGPFLE